MVEEPKPPSRINNLSLTGIAGLAGCFITVMVIAALLIGLWLDARFGLRGPFTVGLVLLSVPVTLWMVVRVVLGLVRAVQPPPKPHQDTDNTSL
ncbi:MAG: hypothetical protein HZC41_18445 [Chloroflexi bacterium]|nr:hypothetical protein [Chloroflexota bacterium]